jgi:cytochrome P450
MPNPDQKSFCPYYPPPRKNKATIWKMFFSARHSWLDALYERSYQMRMGEIHLPGLDLYMVNEPDAVQQVMTDRADAFPKSPLLADALRPLLGDSIFTTNGSQWRRQRTMMNPAFEQARLQVAFPVMQAAVDTMMDRLAQLPDGAEHDMEIEMTHVTADIIFRTIFSQAMEGDDARRIFRAFARFQALAPRLMLPSLFGVRWLVSPLDAWRSRRAAAEIRLLLAKLIRPRHADFLQNSDDQPKDTLQAFMAARDPITDDPFSFDELVDQVAMLFLAGHETSASALSWACYLLAHREDIQVRMGAEVRALGSESPWQAGDLRSLELTRNVFRETLRLFPPVGFIARQASRACTLGTKQLDENATVVVAPWLIQRHRTYWHAPDEFDPDRYQQEASRSSLRDAYLPFGMGPRVCLGAAFALQEAALILGRLISGYRLEPLPGHNPIPVGRLTIRSANGVRLKLHRLAKPQPTDRGQSE